MISHQVIRVLVTLTLVQMMVTIGLRVPLEDVIAAARNWRRLARALAANYVIIPAAALALFEFVQDSRDVAVGLLIVAAFPGASFGPPYTTFARGDLSLAVGLMVILAASSAFVGPVLLRFLVHLTGAAVPVEIDVPKVIELLALAQLVPLVVGMSIRHLLPKAAGRLYSPMELLSKIMNAVSIGCVLFNHFQEGNEHHLAGLPAMLILLLVSLVAGYGMGGPESAGRKAVALTTALRNIGVSVVVASSHNVGAAALGAVIGFAIIEMTGALLLALWWGRGRKDAPGPVEYPAGVSPRPHV